MSDLTETVYLEVLCGENSFTDQIEIDAYLQESLPRVVHWKQHFLLQKAVDKLFIFELIQNAVDKLFIF